MKQGLHILIILIMKKLKYNRIKLIIQKNKYVSDRYKIFSVNNKTYLYLDTLNNSLNIMYIELLCVFY